MKASFAIVMTVFCLISQVRAEILVEPLNVESDIGEVLRKPVPAETKELTRSERNQVLEGLGASDELKLQLGKMDELDKDLLVYRIQKSKLSDIRIKYPWLSEVEFLKIKKNLALIIRRSKDSESEGQ